MRPVEPARATNNYYSGVAQFAGLDLYYADPAQPLTTAGEELDDLDNDLSDLSVRGVNVSTTMPMLPSSGHPIANVVRRFCPNLRCCTGVCIPHLAKLGHPAA